MIFSAGFGSADTRIKQSGLATAPCGSGLCTILDPIDANGNAVIDGNSFQHAPEWTLNFEIDYTAPLSNGDEIYVYTDWKFKGETQDFLYESIEYTFDTQFEGGLRAGYRSTANNYEIGIFARNITDEDNIIGGIDFANLDWHMSINLGLLESRHLLDSEFLFSCQKGASLSGPFFAHFFSNWKNGQSLIPRIKPHDL